MTPSKKVILLASDDEASEEDAPLTASLDGDDDKDTERVNRFATRSLRRGTRGPNGGGGRFRSFVLVLSSAALSLSISDLLCRWRWRAGEGGAVTREDPNPHAAWPRVAWLMSFPNSGTSYTLTLVRAATNRTTGSNYGKECSVDEQGRNVPIHSSLAPTGPCYHRASMERPQHYVLTKTHCGGRCGWCTPDQYTETARSFLMQCASGSVLLPGAKKPQGETESGHGRRHVASAFDTTTREKSKGIGEGRTPHMVKLPSVTTTYDPTVVVQRAIHLIRDPFDNLVSRFHHEMGKHKGDPDFLNHYNSTTQSARDNFRLWCQDHDERYDAETAASRFVDPFLWEMERDLPCHNEFVKYVQWHNLAWEATQTLRLPTHILHYENYTSHFSETLEEILDFLDASMESRDFPEFIANKRYRDYYTAEERQKAAQLMQSLSSTETWHSIQHYFHNL